MVRVILFLVFISFITSCNSTEDNLDGKNDNLKFSADQLGRVEFASSEVDFGEVVLEKQQVRIVQLTNTGKLPIGGFKTFFNERERDATFNFAGSLGSFPGGGTCNRVIQPGESCTFLLTFLPLINGEQRRTFRLQYENGVSTSTVELPLRGYGGEEASLELSETAVEFGFTEKNDQVDRLVTVTNEGKQTAKNINISLGTSTDSDGREVFEILAAGTTCVLNAGQLNIGESCTLALRATASATQDYGTFINNIDITYEYDPFLTDTKLKSLDLSYTVVSIEGVLSVPTSTLDFGDMVNGAVKSRTITVQNTGYHRALLNSAQIAGTMGAASLNIVDCFNTEHELFTPTGQLIIPSKDICLLKLTFAPNIPVASLPGDFSSSNIYLQYDNSKTGVVNSDSFAISANLMTPADLVITGSADPHSDNWNLTDVFVANDDRFEQTITKTLTNTGAVNAKNINITLTGSPYISYTTDCASELGAGESCDVELKLTPSKAIYDATGSHTLNAILSVNYENQTDSSENNPNIVSSVVNVTGAIASRSELAFNNFDTTTGELVIGVPSSSIFYDLPVKNIGVFDEGNFSLNIADSGRFFIVDDPSLTVIEGEPNCAHLDSGTGVLATGSLCYYRIRIFEASLGDYISALSLTFNSGANTSSDFNLTGSFVNPGKIELLTPMPEDRIMVKSYPSFNYPGVGSSINASDPSLVLTTGSGSLSIEQAKMSTPPIPASMNIDFALVNIGYYKQLSTHDLSVGFSNTGEFDIEVQSVQITQIRNETSNQVVTGNQFILPLDGGSDCYSGNVASTISQNSECRLRVLFTPPDNNLYSATVEFTYTLGHKTHATSDTLQTYTSTMTLLGAGYDPSAVAILQPSLPTELVADNQLDMEVVFGVGDSQTTNIVLQNNGAVAATDIHYTVLQVNDPWDISNGTSIVNMTSLAQMAAPNNNYYQLPVAQCSGATANQMNTGENCTLSTTFSPVEVGTSILTVYYRYFNGVTYVSDTFEIKASAKNPAQLIAKGISGALPVYTHDFSTQVVEGSYSQYVELKNDGDVTATALSYTTAATPYRLEPSVDPAFPSCGVSLDPSESCYLELFFEPAYIHVGANFTENFNLSYNNGLNPALAGGNEISTFSIQTSGFAEEKHTTHQGWTEVLSFGENEAYATELTNAGITKPGGGNYSKYDLSYIKFSWNPMIDDGVIANPIDRYVIFKSSENNFNLHTDTPYAYVNAGGAGIPLEFEDKARGNAPGLVWFYYIVAERNGLRSRVSLEDNPIAIIRVATPYARSSLLHKYQFAMEACKNMGIDITDPNNINLTSNGCQHLDTSGSIQTIAATTDIHIDKYEATSSYAASISPHNEAGGTVVQATYTNGLAVCNGKNVSYSTTASGMTGYLPKTFMTKEEHYIISQPSGSYDIDDCVTNNADRKSGDGDLCLSKYLVEYAVGGFPEWTTSEISGFGLGMRTTEGGYINNSFLAKDFSLNFQPILPGFNHKYFVTQDQSMTELCFDNLLGVPVPKVLGACNGQRLSPMTFNAAAANPGDLVIDSLPEGTRFSMMFFNQDVSTQGVSIHALVGGGDLLSAAPLRNYDPKTTEFYSDNYPFGGYRCVTRLAY